MGRSNCCKQMRWQRRVQVCMQLANSADIGDTAYRLLDPLPPKNHDPAVGATAPGCR